MGKIIDHLIAPTLEASKEEVKDEPSSSRSDKCTVKVKLDHDCSCKRPKLKRVIIALAPPKSFFISLRKAKMIIKNFRHTVESRMWIRKDFYKAQRLQIGWRLFNMFKVIRKPVSKAFFLVFYYYHIIISYTFRNRLATEISNICKATYPLIRKCRRTSCLKITQKH